MRTERVAGIVLLAAVLAGATLRGSGSAAETSLQRYGCSESSRYVQARVAIYAGDAQTVDAACEAAFERIDALEKIIYDPNGEVAQINARAGGPAVRASGDLFALLEASQNLSRMTNGAYDPTLRPYQELWSYARQGRTLPEAAEIHRAGAAVGWQKVRLDAGAKSVQLPATGMSLDLKGIARGYIGDQVIAVLKRHGITNALYQAGGTTVASGSAPEGKGWRIGRFNVQSNEPEPTYLQNEALASFDNGGLTRVQGHFLTSTIDPRSGMPMERGTSVRVRASSGALAEGLSKALGILGSEQGCGIVRSAPGTSAYFRQVRQKSGGDDYGVEPEKTIAAWTACS